MLSADSACALIQARQTILPKRLAEPGPDASQQDKILSAAGAAPDHHERIPWRFVIVPVRARDLLGEAFARALLQRDGSATAKQVSEARNKAARVPLLLLAVARMGADANDDVPASERLVSAGCAIQNMLLVATSMGFGSALTSGKAMQSLALRQLFSLQPHEEALCFINIGTVSLPKSPRKRPLPEDYVTELARALHEPAALALPPT